MDSSQYQLAPLRDSYDTGRASPSSFVEPFAGWNAVSSVANGAWNGKRPTGDRPPNPPTLDSLTKIVRVQTVLCDMFKWPKLFIYYVLLKRNGLVVLHRFHTVSFVSTYINKYMFRCNN